MFEVESGQRRARSLGAVVSSGVVLICCFVLAAWVVSARGLGPRVSVAGWEISFRPPRGWREQESESAGFAQSVSYHAPGGGSGRSELTLLRFPDTGRRDGQQLCQDTAVKYLGLQFLGVRGRMSRGAPLGPLPGARLVIENNLYIHAGILPGPDGRAEGYVLVLFSPTGRDLSLGRAMADAVRVVTR